MAFDLEEQEKIAQLRAWWDRFGTLVSSIATVIMLAIIAYYGWNWYQSYQAKQGLSYFDVINTSVSANIPDAPERIELALSSLQNDYGNTVYAPRGTLVAAKYYLSKNNNPQAEKALAWLVAKSDSPLHAEGKLEMASVLANQGKFDQALAQLEKPDVHYKALYLDRKGDVLMAEGKKDLAVQAWKEAKQEAQIDPGFANMIDLKLNVLGGE